MKLCLLVYLKLLIAHVKRFYNELRQLYGLRRRVYRLMLSRHTRHGHL
jgi:hypothetical protein